MPNLAAPYPKDLSWRHKLPRLLAFNQVLVLVGSGSLYMAECLLGNSSGLLGWSYYFVWMQCIALCCVSTTGSATLFMTRKAWRDMPDAAERHAHFGLYRGLLWPSTWTFIAVSIGTVLLASVLAQHLFELLLGSRIGGVWLTQAPPSFELTLINAAYGTLVGHGYDYFQDNFALSKAREKMAQDLSAQAHLNLWRSQLDPHMLFNTLSNLDELIDESPEQAHAMLAHLIGFLRSTLGGSRVTQHALEDEFKLASDYLSLMQIRMGGRLQASLNLPPELSDMLVPAMLLQPLVENAIKHGLEARKCGGQLDVTAQTQAGDLILQVSNSGATDHLVISRDGVHKDSGSGFGLRYVRDRLQALYGTAASLKLQHLSEENVTVLTLRMPLQAPH